MQSSSDEETEAKTSAVVGSRGDVDPTGDVVDFSDTLAITYLPDFDEQYSIKYSAGLGRITTGTNGLRLRHGWMLDNISLDIDNTKLGEFIFNQIDKFTGVAATALTKQPPGTGFTPSSTEAASQAGVTLRINYVVMAQKGIYPLLKPCERDNYLRMCEEAPTGPEQRGRVEGPGLGLPSLSALHRDRVQRQARRLHRSPDRQHQDQRPRVPAKLDRGQDRHARSRAARVDPDPRGSRSRRRSVFVRRISDRVEGQGAEHRARPAGENQAQARRTRWKRTRRASASEE